MATLKQEILFFNDAVGRTLPGAKIYTYDSANPTTNKDTFTDNSLVNLNTNPVIADDGGIFPPIFLESGAYRIVVTDENDVQLFDRDDINASEGTVLTTSALYFDDLVDAKQGITITGETVDLQIGQTIVTLGTASETDGEGAQWLVVAGGTGTPDDDAFADLDNGNQIQRLYNYLYTKNNLSEIADAGAGAQSAARTNLNISGQFLQIASNLSDVANAATARTNLGISSEFLSRANNLSDVNSPSTARTNLAIASEFLSIANNLSDVANAATARTNLDIASEFLSTANNLSEIAAGGATDQQSTRDNLAPAVANTERFLTEYFNESQGTQILDVIATLTASTFETVGPTGSGATHIWTALDALPLTAKTITIAVQNQAISTNTSVAQSMDFKIGTYNALASKVSVFASGSAAGGVSIEGTDTAMIPLDGSNIFTLRYVQAGVTTATLEIRLSSWTV